VVDTVAAIAAAPHLPPTHFVIVGDHTPPFFDRARRGAFIEQYVPFVELIPRRH
jgi:hypothetical protein